RLWVRQRPRGTWDISAGAGCGLRSSQESISGRRLDALVAYQPCRKAFARTPATVVMEGYISGRSGSRRYMRPRGVSALREGVVMDPRWWCGRRGATEDGRNHGTRSDLAPQQSSPKMICSAISRERRVALR